MTHLSPKYEAMRNSKNGWSIHEAGMAQLDDDVGLVMQKLKDMGVDDNTIVVFTTDQAAWDQALPVPARDLLPGRPLHPETWAWLLERAGATDVACHRPTSGPLHAVVAGVGR